MIAKCRPIFIFTANKIIRHAEPSVKTHPTFVSCLEPGSLSWMHGKRLAFPSAIGVVASASCGRHIIPSQSHSRAITRSFAIRRREAPESVPEMPHAAKHHRHAQAIRRRDDI